MRGGGKTQLEDANEGGGRDWEMNLETEHISLERGQLGYEHLLTVGPFEAVCDERAWKRRE